MIETLQEITLNMHGPRNDRACVEAQQSDTGSRKVRIHLQSFDGPYKIPADAKVVLYVRKLDGHKVLNDCEIEDESTVLMTLTTQTVACSGRQTAQLYIFNDEGDIKSQSFCINVPRSTYSDAAVQSTDEFGALQTATAAADKAARECTEATAECLKATEEISTAARSHASAIVVSASGEDIVLADSADAGLQGLRVFGRTEQAATSGKNLWNKDSGNLLGMFISGDQGNVLVTTPNATMVYVECEPNTTYTISKIAGARFQTAYTTEFPNELVTAYGMVYGNTASSHTITTGSDAAYLVSYVHHATHDADITLEEMLASIQIEKGSAATAYEPYTGGIASPNPNYPRELKSAGDGGEISIEILGKNLFNPENVLNMFTNVSSNEVLTNNTCRLVYVKCDPDTVYTVSKKAGQRFYVAYTTAMPAHKVTCLGITGNNTGTSITITTGSAAEYLVAFVYNSQVDTDITAEEMLATVQIEKGDTVTDYEPYKEVQSLTVSTPNDLPGIPVTDVSLANYTDADGQMWCCDEVDFAKGVYVQRTAKEYISGAPKFGESDSTYGRHSWFNIFENAYKGGTVQTVSNFAYWASWGNITSAKYHFAVDEKNLRFNPPVDMTADEVNALFAEMISSDNPPYIIGILAEPVETPLSEDVLAAYKALHTNYPVTTILNDAGAGMEIGYQADTKSYIDNRFAELQSAILSMGGNV